MVYINLLPIREIKRRHKALQQLSVFGVVLVAVLIVLGFVGFYQLSTASGLQKDIAGLQQEKQHFNKILDQIKKLEQDKKEIENRISVINELKKSSALTVHVLDEIANLTPTKRLWLTTLTQSGGSLHLSGMALDNQTIAQYMDNLKTSPYIKEVNLIAAAQKRYAGKNLKSFSLNCIVAVPEADETKTAAAGTNSQ